jgi:hypothetical protein
MKDIGRAMMKTATRLNDMQVISIGNDEIRLASNLSVNGGSQYVLDEDDDGG